MAPENPSSDGALQAKVFVRRARNAAHACLFFLYHFQSTGSAEVDAELEGDRQVALDRVRALVNGVHLPRAFSTAARQAAEHSALGASAPEAPPGTFARVYRMFVERPAPSASADAAMQNWAMRIWQPLNRTRDGLSAAGVDDLVARLQDFLTISRAHSGRDTVNRFMSGLTRLLTRNAALLFGLLVTGFVYGKLEAVHNLVVNMPWRTIVLPFGLVFAGVLLVFLANRGAAFNIGKEAFWRTAYPAVPPDGNMDLVGGTRRIGFVIGRAEVLKLLLLVFWLIISGSVFIYAVNTFEVERTQKTLFVFNCMCLLGLIGLHWLDHWDFLDHRPVRVSSLLMLLTTLGAVLSGYWAELQLWVLVLPISYLVFWVAAVYRSRSFTWARSVGAGVAAFAVVALSFAHETRQEQVWGVGAKPRATVKKDGDGAVGIPQVPLGNWPIGDGPVVLVAASGGGSRAAVYTAYVLERLHRDLPEVAANIQAISSVSGGSLASASYIAMRKQAYAKPATAPFWATEKDELGSGCSGAAEGLRDGELVKAMGHDFIYPTLKGALAPLQGRGQSIESAFDHDAKLENFKISDLASGWPQDSKSAAPYPLPLFNSCTLDAHAVVISPLHRDYYLGGRPSFDERIDTLRKWYGMASEDILTWVLDRDAVLAFTDLNSTFDPLLAQAVRASANFPFGFPLVDVQTDGAYGKPWVNPGTNQVRLTDGGVLSNSGLWTLFHLMTGPTPPERKAIVEPGSGANGGTTVPVSYEAAQPSRERSVPDELSKRGVLLIVVDASHMPEYADNRRDLLTLYGAISDQAPIAQNLHARMFDILARDYGSTLEIVQVDLVPTPEDNVMTTWALDDASKRKLRRSFCRVWYAPSEPTATPSSRTTGANADASPAAQRGLVNEIKGRWSRLQEAAKNPDASRQARMQTPALVRPPLD